MTAVPTFRPDPDSRWPPWIQFLLRDHFMLSASSYKLANRCLRRWAFKAIGEIKEPPTAATEFGTLAHKMLEDFLRDGIAPPIHTKEGKLAYESLPHLPSAGAAEAEVPFAFELDGAWFYGFVDVVDIANQRKIDHKFVGSLDYALDPESLQTDPAAVLYTLAPPVFPLTRLRWIYNLKKKRKDQDYSNPVGASISQTEAETYARRHLVPAWRLLNGIRDLFARHSPQQALSLIEHVPCSPVDCMSFGRPCPGLGLNCSREGVSTLKEITQDD
jgi:hypothetical protein